MTDAPLAAPARFHAMGTDVEVLATDAGGAAMAALRALAIDALEAREARWSRFRPTSELCRINDAARPRRYLPKSCVSGSAVFMKRLIETAQSVHSPQRGRDLYQRSRLLFGGSE